MVLARCTMQAIEDVTELSHKVQAAHAAVARGEPFPAELLAELPNERAYMPRCEKQVLENLAMLPGDRAKEIAGVSSGNAFKV